MGLNKGDAMDRRCAGRDRSTAGPARLGRRRSIMAALGLALLLVLAVAGPAVARDVEGCLICHGDPNFVDPTPNAGEPTSLYVDSEVFAESVHAQQPCSACHRGFVLTIPQHQLDVEKDFRQVAIEACESCHLDAFMSYQTSSHAKFYYQDEAGPICISCHGSHAIRRVRLGEESAEFKMGMAQDSCGRCHEDKFDRARDEFHIKALNLGYERAATCFDCHGYHENLALHSGEQETVEACRKCHPGANVGFTYFQMHLEPHFMNAWWGVRAVYLFFSTLLIVVLVVGIAYTTVHLQKETRILLGVFGGGLGRLFGFIRALEEESRGNGTSNRPPRAEGNGHDDSDAKDETKGGG